MNKADLKDWGLSLLIALGINAVFGVLAALAYWLLGLSQLIGPLVANFAMLWGALFVATLLLNFIERSFRLNLYDRANAYIALNILAGGLLLLAFAAVMALRVQSLGGDSMAIFIAAHIIGFLACYVAHAVVTVIFSGQLYMLINFGFGLGGYGLFAVWPAAAQAVFGWLMA